MTIAGWSDRKLGLVLGIMSAMAMVSSLVAAGCLLYIILG